MNSSQRRQARREFPHVVTMQARESQRYFEHDDRVAKACTWCQRQFGRGAWRLAEGWQHADFKFSEQKDAIYFALKWA
jgi:hypothetical protein